MPLKITGKNFDVGEALRARVSERIEEVVEKLFSNGFSGHVMMEREKSRFHTECAIHLDSGVHLQARGEHQDVYASFDQAADRLEKRLRRYTRRLKNHHDNKLSSNDVEQIAAGFVLAGPSEDLEDDEPEGLNPVIIAEAPVALRRLSVGEAVMEMDLAEAPVIVFRNAASGGLNVVYRRHDGNIGWIDPERGQGEPGDDN